MLFGARGEECLLIRHMGVCGIREADRAPGGVWTEGEMTETCGHKGAETSPEDGGDGTVLTNLNGEEK